MQGLNQTGTDLEAVAKFLDASGAKLDYRRYAETLFDILVAGGMLGNYSQCCVCVLAFTFSAGAVFLSAVILNMVVYAILSLLLK